MLQTRCLNLLRISGRSTKGKRLRRSIDVDRVRPGCFIVALAVALVGLACFGYFTLKKTNIQLTQLFGNQATLNTLGQRVNTAESKLLDVTGRWEGLAQGVTMLESKVNRNVQQTSEVC
jgi:hypothetical protein